MYEMKLGEATYEIHRAFAGDRPVSALLVDRLVQEKQEKTVFDEPTDDAV